MQAAAESIFDIAYLITVISQGVMMIVFSRGERQYRLFGIMAVILGCGDAFHLIPRVGALCTYGLEHFVPILRAGKLVTSVTMTIFYVFMYHVWRERYKITGAKTLSVCVYALAAVRTALCLFPQNAWTSANPPTEWGIYRNIPFALLGLIIIVLFYTSAKNNADAAFRHMWLAVTFSFAFYIPVVLFADRYPIVGMLMIPKTCAYVWIVAMGYRAMDNEVKKHE